MTIKLNWKTVALGLLILLAISKVWAMPSAHLSEDLQPLVNDNAGAADSLVPVVVFLDTDSDAPSMIPAERPMTRASRIKTITRKLKEIRPRAAGSVESILNRVAEGPVRRLWIVPAYSALVPVSAVGRLAAVDGVKSIVSDLAVSFDSPVATSSAPLVSASISTHLQLLNIPAVWSRGITGHGRLVCNFDTGVDGLHPALADKWRGRNTSLSASWFSPYNPEPQPSDRSGHGTHTMGVMVASDGADTVGVAPDAEWIAAGVIDQGGSLQTTISDILEGYEWALDPDGNPSTTDDVPDVILNSWGLPRGLFSPCDDTFWQAVDNVEAAGIVTIFAAGNEGPDASTLRSPADRASGPLTNLAVGAVDNQMTIASFSSRGPSSCNGEIKPEIVAPGVAVRSTYRDGGYTYMSGTSMAAPYIAGMVALARQYNPDATVTEIKTAIIQSARDLGTAGEDNAYGWGLPDAEVMLDLLPLPESPRFDVASYDIVGHDYALPGDTIALSLELESLGGNVKSITGRLEPLDELVSVTLNQAAFEFANGTITATNMVPYRLILDTDLPHGHHTDFKLNLIDQQGEEFDSLFFSISIGYAPDGAQASHRTGRIDWTVSDFAQYGLGTGSIYNTGGFGFSVDGSENLLYEAGLIVGRSEVQLSSSIRGENGEFASSDFVATDELSSQLKSGQSRMVAGMRDLNSPTPVPVKIWQTSRSFTDAGFDGFVLMQYDLVNVTLSRIRNLHFGFMADFDLSDQSDHLVFDPSEKLIYQQAEGEPLVGLVALENVNSWVMADNGSAKRGFSDAEKIDLIRTTSLPTGGMLTGDGYMAIGTGSIDLDVRDTVRMAFALVTGQDVNELYENVKAARDAYLMPTDVFSEGEGVLPQSFELAQNYPNPFNPSTTIAFVMRRSGNVQLDVYNMLGQRVTTLYDGPATVGRHTVEWDGMAADGMRAASGVYFYRIEANGENQTRKMMLIK